VGVRPLAAATDLAQTVLQGNSKRAATRRHHARIALHKVRVLWVQKQAAIAHATLDLVTLAASRARRLQLGPVLKHSPAGQDCMSLAALAPTVHQERTNLPRTQHQHAQIAPFALLGNI
jgi:hypothetical protein